MVKPGKLPEEDLGGNVIPQAGGVRVFEDSDVLVGDVAKVFAAGFVE